ncbi:MAG: bifunctional [glutamate--ammonia ligase]-adenylyl-L-tyrosine phosphorylase/[glutamate--ammonia-ligase] adenylyltransferase [Burkholderiaceae bacterium]|nr:bifunctional [glutamate--ammonia ligase]-adenylyl-L-tyrosine phosphorylase/[glutamate--ammonia-ligase] adenylyltransferase [Burkholderiales bacterium]MCZ8339876.1 bifunctional [glutamate--ammonia ligase]-adenylyl-L-tyrosine phosphorylase/[glutamate--ammonia-ligase] adenylyltransferase [Burkholderiaceae bacterium]
MVTDGYEARSGSAWFGRTLDALSRRQPSLAALLPAMVERPLDEAAVVACWERAVALSSAAGASAVGGGPAVDPGPALRRARQLLVLAIVERDVRQRAPLAEVCGAISAWGRLSTRIALHHAAAELAAQHGRPLDGDGRPQDLLVVGMGKLGGDELNVSSDIDLVFVHRDGGTTEGGARGAIPSGEFFHRVARRTAGLLSDPTEDGFVFRVDTRLRPNGDSGPLACTLPMLEQYFYDQGREWERFAWLKGAVIADSGLAGDAARSSDEAALAEIVQPFVFRRYLDFAVFGALRELHGQIRAEADRRDARRGSRDGGGVDVKLGRGGIREIEFCAQLFQIVRGGRDPGLRDRRTLATLDALAQRRLLEPAAAARLADAYVLLRRVEHAVQYQEDAQTHRLPDDPAVRARIASMLAMTPDAFDAALADARAHVEQVFDALLSDPARRTDAPVPEDGDALALDDAGRARVTALREGRRYRLARPDTQRTIDQLLERALREGTPADGPPGTPPVADAVWLGRLVDLLETVAGRPAYLALLAQYPAALRRVLSMIGQAKWAADYLTRHPVVLDELLDGQILQPSDHAAWERDLRAALAATTTRGGEPDVERQMDMLREAHHAQVFRLLAQDLAGTLTVERLSDHLSELADRVLAIVLERAWAQVRGAHREVPRFAIVAYGKLGGKELGYASDLDLVFVHDDDDERAPAAYAQLAQRMSAWLQTRTAAGLLFEIDLRLRPNGDAGLPVVSLRAFESYQRESAWVWEHQALTRARFAAGDAAIGAKFEALRRDVLRQPRDAVALAAEVRAMRRKMTEGHPNRSAQFDVKHDAGGMVDIEFLVQYMVLAHSAAHPELLDDAGNIALLDRAAKAGLIDPTAAAECAQAYRDLRRLQHVLRLNDARYARVEPETVAAQRAAVRGLWKAVLGE